MIPGVKLVLGDTEYTVPPLPFNAIKKHKAFLDRAMQGKIDQATIADDLESMADVVYLALRRNYPELTAERLGEQLDLRNVQAAFVATIEAMTLGLSVGETKPAGR
jgi:hypothetical protein